ncbi:MAG: hypothetical protein HY645_09240 [Acidobacteria bacterium]|nr:hypothetical protein [Acidobacteriota bacterium]
MEADRSTSERLKRLAQQAISAVAERYLLEDNFIKLTADPQPIEGTHSSWQIHFCCGEDPVVPFTISILVPANSLDIQLRRDLVVGLEHRLWQLKLLDTLG